MGKPTDENYRKLQDAETYDSAELDNMIDREFSATLDKMMHDKGVSTTELVKARVFQNHISTVCAAPLARTTSRAVKL